MSFQPQIYEKAHADFAVFDRKECAQIEVSGTDHAAFLHQILSQDMLEMQPREWREASLLSATSHVLAYLFAIKLENSVLLVGSPGSFEKVCRLLEKFHITEDVQIQAPQEKWDFLEVWGNFKSEKSGRLHFKPEGQNGKRTLLLSKSSENLFQKERVTANETREVLRIENSVLEFGKDFDENFMLSETRLEKRAASETKGCYPGQEVVAKIETYKRLNRSFVRLTFSAEILPAEGSVICNAAGEEIGRLTSRAYAPFLKKNFGLGWLKRGFFEQPVEVSVKSETAIPAFVSLFEN